MGGRIAESNPLPQHYCVKSNRFTPFRLLFCTEAMTPEEIKNESMRVLKAKEIEEIDKKVEKDMIELTILEAIENIEKYQKETKAWRDKKVVRKDIKLVI
jgi:hypothetical protein